MNFVTLILAHARTQPDAPALVDGERIVSYRELAVLVRRIAGHLASLGVAPGDRVGICLKDSWQHLVALLAVGHMGAVIVQIDARARPHEKTRIADTLRLKLALIEPDDELAARCPAVAVDATWQDAGPTRVYDPRNDWNAPLIITMTSGTTGAPKFSIASHRQYYFRTTILPEMPRRAPQTRYLSSLPLCFSAGRGIAIMHLIRGDCVVLYAALFGAEEFVEAVTKYQATAGLIAPSAVRQLLQIASTGDYLLPTLDSLICGGGPLFADEKRDVVRRLTPNLFEFYGATAIGTISILRPGHIADRADSVGQPNALIEVEVVDEADRTLGPGAVGRLRCRGPGLGEPVTQDPGADLIEDGWYYPGEIGSLDESGFLYLQGRESEVIIRGGAKIHPSEIEAAMLTHPAVAEAAIIGVRAPDNEEAVVAFVIAKGPLDAGDLVAHCRARLTPYKVPREIRIVATLPRNTGGKIDKIELAKAFAATPLN